MMILRDAAVQIGEMYSCRILHTSQNPREMSAFTQTVFLYAALISFFLYTAFNDWFSKGSNGCFLGVTHYSIM